MSILERSSFNQISFDEVYSAIAKLPDINLAPAILAI